ncbi:MAG: hypothetical protein ABDH21_01380 [bacterium]
MEIQVFKKFAQKFPEYYKIKNPNFLIMTKYYLRKPTFKYLWYLFYKNPLRILYNLFVNVLPLLVWELFKKLMNGNSKIDSYADIGKEKLIDYFSKGQGFITISYCQKPFKCPDGRFSTKCTAKYDVCQSCFLSKIKARADQLGLDYYIVLGDYDSVWNILKNQFLKRKHGGYVLTVCVMVLNVIKYLSPLFGFRGLIVPFTKGECKTLAAYELAEFGYKNVETDISDKNKNLLLEILDQAIKKKYSMNFEKTGGNYEKQFTQIQITN